MKYLLPLLCLIVLAAQSSFAEVKPAALFTDNMVLQRNKPVSVWGRSDANETLRVTFNGQTKETTAGKEGKWLLKLDPMQEGGPYDMLIEGRNKIILKNIMIGEVWICSGQSNMEFTMEKSDNAAAEILMADYPMIRLFQVKHNIADTPLEECSGKWAECTSASIAQFSASAYYFGRELLKELKVPVGLIQSTRGGTAAECWMPSEVLQADDDFKPILSAWEKKMADYPEQLARFNSSMPELTAKWKLDSAYAVAHKKALPRKPAPPDGPGSRNTPSGLYNAMIAPLIPFTFQGVIWYQGEANAAQAVLYRKLFPALIHSWRERWKQGEFPFYFVQLPNLDREPDPLKSNWALLREAQKMTLSVPNTGMAVTIDVGDPLDLHPKNKKDVGFRLALIAKALTYKKSVEYSGPLFKEMEIAGNKILLTFEHTAGGLIIKNSGLLKGFIISGADGTFLPAEAEIQGNKVLVWNKSIEKPVHVRYAWGDNPDCNLYNSAMLPASPFRTDSATEAAAVVKQSQKIQ